MRSILKVLNRVESVAASIAYVIVVAAMLADIILREIFGISFIETPKIALSASIVAGLIGLGLATSQGTHIRPKFTDKWLPDNWRANAGRLGDLLSTLAFGYAGWMGIELVKVAIEYKFLVPAVDWPLWPFQLLMPYAFFSNAIRHLAFTIYPELKPQEALQE